MHNEMCPEDPQDFELNPEDDSNLVDLDGDGINESTIEQFDIDGDGENDTEVITSDTDGDGEFDTVIAASDTDGDGKIDTEVAASDTDGDGKIDTVVVTSDTDGDGKIDTVVVTSDTDGDSELGSVQVEPDQELIGNEEFNYDNNPDIIGDPADDMENWHQQQNPDTCAIVAQEFILDEIGEDFGIEFNEEELRQQAIENGWYIPGGGTPFNDVGKLLELNGIEVERTNGATLEDLENKLEDGEKIIVGVDADEIWNPGMDDDDPIYEFLGMPGQDANHAVQVIGIDKSDPDNPVVILNDPGTPNGRGLRVPADVFVDAWEDSNNYVVSTTGNVIA